MHRWLDTTLGMPDITFSHEERKKSVSYSFFYNPRTGQYIITETRIVFGDPRPVIMVYETNTLEEVIDFRKKNFSWRLGDGYKEFK